MTAFFFSKLLRSAPQYCAQSRDPLFKTEVANRNACKKRQVALKSNWDNKIGRTWWSEDLRTQFSPKHSRVKNPTAGRGLWHRHWEERARNGEPSEGDRRLVGSKLCRTGREVDWQDLSRRGHIWKLFSNFWRFQVTMKLDSLLMMPPEGTTNIYEKRFQSFELATWGNFPTEMAISKSHWLVRYWVSYCWRYSHQD